MTQTDQLVLAVVVGLVGLFVLVTLRATKPGAPARMGAIVAGLMLLLTVLVGLRAQDPARRSCEMPGAIQIHLSAEGDHSSDPPC